MIFFCQSYASIFALVIRLISHREAVKDFLHGGAEELSFWMFLAMFTVNIIKNRKGAKNFLVKQQFRKWYNI